MKLTPYLPGDLIAKEGSTFGFGLEGGPTKTSSSCKTSPRVVFVLVGVPRDFFANDKTGKSCWSGVGECADGLRGLSMIAERCLSRRSGIPSCLIRLGIEIYERRFRAGWFARFGSLTSSFDPRAPQPIFP